MKKIIAIIALCMSTSMFAQMTSANTAYIKGNAETIASQIETGRFEVYLDNASAEDVKKAASYYTKFFSVIYNDVAKVASIKMVSNTPEARKVFIRFMVTLKNTSVNFDGKIISIEDFYAAYMAK